MNRLILWIMILTMVFSLSACQGEQTSPAGKDVPVNQTTDEKKRLTGPKSAGAGSYYFTGGLLWAVMMKAAGTACDTIDYTATRGMPPIFMPENCWKCRNIMFTRIKPF